MYYIFRIKKIRNNKVDKDLGFVIIENKTLPDAEKEVSCILEKEYKDVYDDYKLGISFDAKVDKICGNFIPIL